MYQLLSNEAVRRLTDNTTIPFNPINPDYQAYLAWTEEGNVPKPASSPEPMQSLTAAEKLAVVGLTVDDLKALLGL